MGRWLSHHIYAGGRMPRWPTLVLAVASIALTAAATGPTVLPGDVTTAREVQESTVPTAADIATFGNQAGALATAIAVAALLALAMAFRGWWREAALMALTVLARSLNPLLKAIAASPRPTPDLVRVARHYHGLGFPSGHAMGAMLLFGGIAIVAHERIRHRVPRLTVQVAAGLMILATGFARVYVGAHWPSDVLGGYLWGTLLLLGLRRVLGHVPHRPAPL